MVNVHFICFADTVLLHTENDNFHHFYYNTLPMHVLSMQLLVDLVYTFRNFVNFTSKKRNVAVYMWNCFTLSDKYFYCDVKQQLYFNIEVSAGDEHVSFIVCSHDTVFPSYQLELSPSLEYNSRDLSTSPVLKLLYWTSFSEVFTLYSSVFSLKIRITQCFKKIIRILEKIPFWRFINKLQTSHIYMAEFDKVSGL